MACSLHLVGSIPLQSTEAVFREIAHRIGPFLKRLPDGETGERSAWTAWQGKVVERTKGVVRSGIRDVHGIAYPTYALQPGVSPHDLDFGNLGYADSAYASWQDFLRMRSEGVVQPKQRFQICLPTPLAVIQAFFWGSQHLPAICRSYEKALLAEVNRIIASIPNEHLSLQWDIAVEFHRIWEKPTSDLARQFPSTDLITTIASLSDHIPTHVELGWHFCYGDAGHKHFVEPSDAGLMVDVANQLTGATKRNVTWLHIPVPRDRSDATYFWPLTGLRRDKISELYLGLIHLTDGIDGAQKRIAGANTAVSNFGLATECGFGRRPANSIQSLLELHRSIASF
jgi:hypothetical protein